MVEWVLTVTSIAIIVLLCDVILPEGQTRKYIKTVLGVVVTFVIVQPLAGVFTSVNYETVQSANSDFAVQEYYIENAAQRQDEQMLTNLKLTLTSNGFNCEEASVSAAGESVTIRMSERFDQTSEQKVHEIAKKFFSSYKIIIYWK